MGETDKHEDGPNNQSQRQGQPYKGPVFITIEALSVTALLTLGYMFATDSTHRNTAIWIFFAAYVLVGLFAALYLTRSSPNRLDSYQPSSLQPTPTIPMKEDRSKQSINTVNQSGGQNIIAGGDVHLGPPRREITPEQEKIILSNLADAPKGKVVMQVNGGDQEAINLQQRIEGILKRAGFEVTTWSGLVPLDGKRPIGLILFVKDKMSVPAHARAIKDAMHQAGLEGALGLDAGVDVDALFIEVGANPLNP